MTITDSGCCSLQLLNRELREAKSAKTETRVEPSQQPSAQNHLPQNSPDSPASAPTASSPVPPAAPATPPAPPAPEDAPDPPASAAPQASPTPPAPAKLQLGETDSRNTDSGSETSGQDGAPPPSAVWL